MDCRKSLWVVVGFAAFCAGCATDDQAQLPNSQQLLWPQQAQIKQEQGAPSTATSATVLSPKPRPASRTARRKLHAETELKYAEFQEKEALSKKTSPRQREGLLGRARDAFQQALGTDPANVAAARGLARVYGHLGEHQRAAEVFQNALKKHPQDAELLIDKGWYHARRKEYSLAIKCLSRARRLKPDDRETAQALAICLAGAGRFSESLQVLTQIFGEAKANMNMARVFEKLQQTEQARRHLQMAFQLDPQLSRSNEGRTLVARLQPATPLPTSDDLGIQRSDAQQAADSPTSGS